MDKNNGDVGNNVKKEKQEEALDFEIAQNPDPRANENIKDSAFEKKNPEEKAVGTEITDGESG